MGVPQNTPKLTPPPPLGGGGGGGGPLSNKLRVYILIPPLKTGPLFLYVFTNIGGGQFLGGGTGFENTLKTSPKLWSKTDPEKRAGFFDVFLCSKSDQKVPPFYPPFWGVGGVSFGDF